MVAIGPAHAQSRVVTVKTTSLETAFTQLARQAGWQILFDPAIMRGETLKESPPPAPPQIVLRWLLRDRSLDVRWLSARALMIVRSSDSERTEIPYGSDIVVTALKQPTMMANTPVSMSVVPGRTRSAAVIKDMKAVSRRHPELSVIDSASNQQRLAIRGVAGSGEATVGVYYNETAISGPGGTTFDPGAISPDLDFVDIDRIELLRGPQGTLYGASAMGGVVRVAFNPPNPAVWHGETRLGFEQTESADLGRTASSVLNAPLILDRLAARFSLYSRHIGGFVQNPNLGQNNMGGVEKWGGRLAVAWSAEPGTSILASAIVQHTRMNDAAFWYRDEGRYQNNQSTRTPQRNDLEIYNITAQRDFDDVLALLTISRYVWRFVRQIDYSAVLSKQSKEPGACRNYFSLSPTDPCSPAHEREFASFVESRLPGLLYQPMRLGSWSAELRLSGQVVGGSKWTAGAYFEQRNEKIQSYALLADPTSGIPVRPFDITGLRSLDSTLQQKAVFGEWTAPLSDALSLVLGGRLFHYQRNSGGKVDIPNRVTGTATLQEGNYTGKQSGANVKALLSYQHSPDLLVYSLVSQGYRPGGVNITPTLDQDQRYYKADRLWNYELGVKMNTLNRMVTMNAGVYRMVWSNMITPIFTESGAFGYNTNVGRATIYGAETELVFAPNQKTSLEGRISLLDARLTEDHPIDLSGFVARKSDRLSNTPSVVFSIGLERRQKFARGIVATIRTDFSYFGPVNSAFNRSNPYFERTPSRTLTDLLLSFETGSWEAGISVRNLFNTRSPMRIQSSALGKGQTYGPTPRTISAEIAHHF